MSRCSYPTLPALWKLLAVGEGQSLPSHSPPTEHEVSSVGGSYRPPKPDSGGTPRGIDDGVGNALCLTTQLVMLEISWFRVTDEEEVDDLLGFANFEWDEIQFDEASRFEEVTQTYKTRQRKVYKRTQMVMYKTGQRKPCKVEKVDDDNNSAINDDNAFDYEEPERASPTRNVAASDDNSADEYHPSNFKSPSDSDEYEPSDE
ncbi:hypothetical protein JG687_00018820 [Phytophthora cactorum]|uniref:Uncharacterized protein n=1 Tax=Phytophthora cactorum TaxID=29920 RepID=A0A8T1TLS8_9STRA|nr:hypothetical protein JG687_00018820 [Phytophthora cactorum]